MCRRHGADRPPEPQATHDCPSVDPPQHPPDLIGKQRRRLDQPESHEQQAEQFVVPPLRADDELVVEDFELRLGSPTDERFKGDGSRCETYPRGERQVRPEPAPGQVRL